MSRDVDAHRTPGDHEVPPAGELSGQVRGRLATVDAGVSRTHQGSTRQVSEVEQMPRIPQTPQSVRLGRAQVAELFGPERVGGGNEPRTEGGGHMGLGGQGAFHAAVPAQTAGCEFRVEGIAVHLMLSGAVVVARIRHESGALLVARDPA